MASATALLGTAIVDDDEEVVVGTAAVNATSARVVVGSTTVTTACTEVGGVATDGSGRPVDGPLVQPTTLAAASATPIERRLTANWRRRVDIRDGSVWKQDLEKWARCAGYERLVASRIVDPERRSRCIEQDNGAILLGKQEACRHRPDEGAE